MNYQTLRQEQIALLDYFALTGCARRPYANAWMRQRHSETAHVLRQLADAWNHQWWNTSDKLDKVGNQIMDCLKNWEV